MSHRVYARLAKVFKTLFNSNGMNNLEKLKDLFMQLPGIGPRQAGRFVHFLLMRGSTWRSSFISLIQELDTSVTQCDTCMRFFQFVDTAHHQKACNICANNNRDDSKLMVVVNDIDIKQIEKSGAYNGRYFVLGSLLSLKNSKTSYTRLNELKKLVKEKRASGSSAEIIFALPATADGEHTTDTLRKELKNICKNDNCVEMTILGRGLSTGSEVEYADPDTLKSALHNRS